ncbi:unnamed protein product [Meloidogyne enterolobii]|uniref:Uncharacterized protein n=1 Tax=Meloidogyne enterolobii TaxID=390850 RepID=A0ACB0YNT7_MELEN
MFRATQSWGQILRLLLSLERKFYFRKHSKDVISSVFHRLTFPLPSSTFLTFLFTLVP